MVITKGGSVASKKDSNGQQIDADTQQANADVLRASDIIPPYDKEPRRNAKSQNDDKPTQLAKTDLKKTKTAEPEKKPAKPAQTRNAKAEIPRFDLAKEIMAEQRKITAFRRKAPGRVLASQQKQTQTQPLGYAVGQPTSLHTQQEQIISEIVARDIQRLCGSDISGADAEGFKNSEQNSTTQAQPHTSL